jgi:hypothetical protein
MKTLQLLVLFCVVAFATSVKAELITASESGGSGTLTYTWPGGEEYPNQDQLYYSSYDFEAYYDTDTGEGHYIYTVYGYTNLTVEWSASGGAWSQVSYYTDYFAPQWLLDFWGRVYPPQW